MFSWSAKRAFVLRTLRARSFALIFENLINHVMEAFWSKQSLTQNFANVREEFDGCCTETLYVRMRQANVNHLA